MTVYQANILDVSCVTPGTQPTFSVTLVSNAPGGTYFQAQLYSGTASSLTPIGNPTAATLNQNLIWSYAAQVPSGGGLSPTTTYWMVVWTSGSGGVSPGPGSPPVKLVYTTVPLLGVAVSGARVTLQWSYGAVSLPADGLTAQIVANNQAVGPPVQLPLAGFVIGSQPSDYACTWSFDVDFPLAAAPVPLTLNFWPYTETATAGSISNVPATMTGPVVAQPLFFAGPSVQSAEAVSGQAGQYALTVPNIFGAATSVSLRAILTANGAPIAGATLSTPTVSAGTVSTTLTLPTTVLPGARLEVALAQTDGLAQVVSVGPPGPSHTIVTGTAVLSGATFTPPITVGEAGTLSFTLDFPPAQPPLAAARVTIVDAVSGATIGGPVSVSGASGNVTGTLSAGKTYNVLVQGISGSDTGPVASAVPLLFTPPALSTVTYDGHVVAATWSAPDGVAPSGYRMQVGNGYAASRIEVAGLSAELAIPAGATGLQLSVAPFSTNGLFGPASSGITLLTETLSVAAVTTDPVLGNATVSWSDPSTNDYLLQVYENGAPSGAPISVTAAQKYQFTKPFAPDARIDVAVATTGSVTPSSQSTAVTVTGPYGPPRRLPTVTPTITGTDFDGASACVWWTPVADATGYNVYLITAGAAGTASVQPATATFAQIAIPGPLSPSSTYQVAVQAIFGPDTGPATPAATLFAPGYYLAPSSSSAGTAIFPSTSLALPLVSALSGLPAVSTNIDCYMAQLAPGAVGSVTAAGPFSLAANSGAGAAAYPFVLTIAGGASSEAWTFNGAAFREQLQQDYVSFLINAETAGVSPYGIWLLQQAIARALPQTFAETLFYAYGFNPTTFAANLLTKGTVDLRPGTILRIAADAYQNVPGEAGTGAAISEFTGGPTLELEMTSYLSGGKRIAGFDAFLAQLAIAGALAVDRPRIDPNSWQQPGIANAADLFFSDFQQPFFRLFMPGSLQDAWGVGSNVPANNMAIVAAQSFTTLSRATSSGVDVPGMAKAYFGGRSVARVCIRVILQDNSYVVPLGTTVGDGLDMLGLRPPSAGAALRGITLSRSLGGLVTNPGAAYDVGARYRVRFDWNTLSIYGFSADALDLPLLHGDVLKVRG